jgi:hypothetical protein
LLDENLRGPLWHAFQQHNAGGLDAVDSERVGDPPDLLLGSKDPDILLWCEREDRVLVTSDKKSIAGHLTAHLQQGRHSPGILVLRPGYTIGEWLLYLVLTAYTFDPAEVQDQVTFLP